MPARVSKRGHPLFSIILSVATQAVCFCCVAAWSRAPEVFGDTAVLYTLSRLFFFMVTINYGWAVGWLGPFMMLLQCLAVLGEYISTAPCYRCSDAGTKECTCLDQYVRISVRGERKAVASRLSCL